MADQAKQMTSIQPVGGLFGLDGLGDAPSNGAEQVEAALAQLDETALSELEAALSDLNLLLKQCVPDWLKLEQSARMKTALRALEKTLR